MYDVDTAKLKHLIIYMAYDDVIFRDGGRLLIATVKPWFGGIFA